MTAALQNGGLHHDSATELLSQTAKATSNRLSKLDGQAPESTDFANYFCTYGYLYHQVHRRC